MVKTFLLIILALLAIILAYFFLGWPMRDQNMIYGMTWSGPYARYLGIDSQEGLRAALQELKLTHVRLPAYWSIIEPQQGKFDFVELDQQLDLITEHQGKVILVVGAKQPRWPECWIPDWTKNMSESEREQAQFNYVKEVILHVGNRSVIEAWQVENEPEFTFGECAPLSKSFIEKEMAFVRGLDKTLNTQHPIYTTASGELSSWLDFGRATDGLGISIYRVVETPLIGTFHYSFLPPWIYKRKAWLLRWWTGPVYVSEFQMEPWFKDGSAINLPLEAYFKTFNSAQMKKNFWFAERTGFERVYFWGVEWWYWMKIKKNHPEFWDVAKQHSTL
ncbi:hypothetical protein FJZ48_02905 [Candidatus Uhrbacteria bacterium]|nr:hypothetical protein [Candidatus Uhrbacteria bacterium]